MRAVKNCDTCAAGAIPSHAAIVAYALAINVAIWAALLESVLVVDQLPMENLSPPSDENPTNYKGFIHKI